MLPNTPHVPEGPQMALLEHARVPGGPVPKRVASRNQYAQNKPRNTGKLLTLSEHTLVPV